MSKRAEVFETNPVLNLKQMEALKSIEFYFIEISLKLGEVIGSRVFPMSTKYKHKMTIKRPRAKGFGSHSTIMHCYSRFLA